jgi:hyperosmotically inducible protein
MTQCARFLAVSAVAVALAGGCSNDNASLTARVQAHVNNSVTSPSANIEAVVDDGVVTLSGTVPSAPMKAQAETAAKQVDGVKAVKDDLEVMK